MKIMSIDPGITGSICISNDSGEHDFYMMPNMTVKNKKVLDGVALFNIMNQAVDLIVIEQVHSMPGQGVASMFSFGKAYGMIIGIAHALQHLYSSHLMFVTPQQWKRRYGLLKGEKEDVLQVVSHQFINEQTNKQKRITFSESYLINQYGRFNYEANDGGSNGKVS